jgi:hypothetical protein
MLSSHEFRRIANALDTRSFTTVEEQLSNVTAPGKLISPARITLTKIVDKPCPKLTLGRMLSRGGCRYLRDFGRQRVTPNSSIDPIRNVASGNVPAVFRAISRGRWPNS